MREEEFERCIALAHELADLAAEPQLRHFRSPDLRGSTKPDFTPVTEADREAEARMRAAIRKRFPEHGMEGEEFGVERGDAEWIWRLDPIDGTKAFLAGKPTFCTLIALYEGDRPMLGLIDQAVSRERWIGVAGRRSTYNGDPIHTRPCETLDAAVLAATAPEQFENGAERAAFEKVEERVRIASWGGDAYNYALLAMGQIDLVVEAGLATHDVAALAPVIEGAGGVITDWRGEPFTAASAGRIVAAGDAETHAAALALLRLD